MRKHFFTEKGQSAMEYVLLFAAASLGIWLALKLTPDAWAIEAFKDAMKANVSHAMVTVASSGSGSGSGGGDSRGGGKEDDDGEDYNNIDANKIEEKIEKNKFDSINTNFKGNNFIVTFNDTDGGNNNKPSYAYQDGGRSIQLTGNSGSSNGTVAVTAANTADNPILLVFNGTYDITVDLSKTSAFYGTIYTKGTIKFKSESDKAKFHGTLYQNGYIIYTTNS